VEPGAVLTGHAAVRISGRLSLTAQVVRVLLDSGLFVLLSEDKNKNCVRKLIYSEIDDLCFVVIQNCVNGNIVTIHEAEHCAEISTEAMAQAKELVGNIEIGTYFNPVLIQNDQKIRFGIYYLDSAANQTRVLNIKVTANKYLGILDPLEANAELEDELCEMIKRSLRPKDIIMSAFFKITEKDKARYFPVKNLLIHLDSLRRRSLRKKSLTKTAST